MVSESKKERWKVKREAEKEQFEDRQKKAKAKKTVLWVLGITIVLIVSFFIYKKVTGPGQYDSFAQCMTEKGWTMYGTDWCPHCQRQKELFGKSVGYINYVNCDLSNQCDAAGVQAYPTWGGPDGLLPSGTKSLAELAKASGCTLS